MEGNNLPVLDINKNEKISENKKLISLPLYQIISCSLIVKKIKK